MMTNSEYKMPVMKWGITAFLFYKINPLLLFCYRFDVKNPVNYQQVNIS